MASKTVFNREHHEQRRPSVVLRKRDVIRLKYSEAMAIQLRLAGASFSVPKRTVRSVTFRFSKPVSALEIKGAVKPSYRDRFVRNAIRHSAQQGARANAGTVTPRALE